MPPQFETETLLLLGAPKGAAAPSAAQATSLRQEDPERAMLAFRSPAMAERLVEALSLHLQTLEQRITPAIGGAAALPGHATEAFVALATNQPEAITRTITEFVQDVQVIFQQFATLPPTLSRSIAALQRDIGEIIQGITLVPAEVAQGTFGQPRSRAMTAASALDRACVLAAAVDR